MAKAVSAQARNNLLYVFLYFTGLGTVAAYLAFTYVATSAMYFFLPNWTQTMAQADMARLVQRLLPDLVALLVYAAAAWLTTPKLPFKKAARGRQVGAFVAVAGLLGVIMAEVVMAVFTLADTQFATSAFYVLGDISIAWILFVLSGLVLPLAYWKAQKFLDLRK